MAKSQTSSMITASPFVIDDDYLNNGLIGLEVYKVDVTRLRDDRSEIHSGDDVMFVATARFRVSSTSGSVTSPQSAQRGDDLFSINSDGDITSPHEMDEDAVEAWLQKRFKFSFAINGHPFERDSAVGDPPWILRLDTSLLPDLEYINVDVEIERGNDEQHALLERPSTIAPLLWWSADKSTCLTLELDVANLPADQPLKLELRLDENVCLPVRLTLSHPSPVNVAR